MKELKGKVVLVTGSASGIGRATSLAFAGEGCDIILADINEKGMDEVEGEIRDMGRKTLSMITDVSREKDMARLKEKSFEVMGRVDIVVSNAGTAIMARTEELTASEWKKVLGVNLWGTIHAIKYFIPPMVERNQGHFVVLSSGMGLTALPYLATYVTSKFALVGLTECLRAEMAHHNIDVTTICPGVINTPIFTTSPLKGFSPDAIKLLGWAGAMEPEKLGRIIVRAVQRNKGLVPVTWLAWTTYGLKRVSSRFLDRMLVEFARSARKYRVEEKVPKVS